MIAQQHSNDIQSYSFVSFFFVLIRSKTFKFVRFKYIFGVLVLRILDRWTLLWLFDFYLIYLKRTKATRIDFKVD